MDSLIELESAIRRLESSLDVFDWWLTFWTAAVVIGLVVEYGHDVWRLIWRRPFNWGRVRKLIGGILITLGVAGELIVGIKISAIQVALRVENGKVIALLDGKAEEAQLARVTLEKLIQPRRLTLEQEVTLRSKAEMFAGTRVVFKVYDAEGWVLAKQLGSALKNWDAENIAWVIPGDVVAFGVAVEAWNEDNRVAAELLVNELIAAKIAATLGEPIGSPTLNVRIGVKPLPK